MKKATPIGEPPKLRRAPYWGLYLFFVFIQVGVSYVDEGLLGLWFMLLLAVLAISYARVKDIGWHGFWTLLAVIPLGNVFLGCVRSADQRKTAVVVEEHRIIL